MTPYGTAQPWGHMQTHAYPYRVWKCPQMSGPFKIHRDSAEPYGSVQTTTDLRQKVRNRPHYSRHVQFQQTAVCGTACNTNMAILYMCSNTLDTRGTVWFYKVPHGTIRYHTLSEQALRHLNSKQQKHKTICNNMYSQCHVLRILHKPMYQNIQSTLSQKHRNHQLLSMDFFSNHSDRQTD